MFLHHFICSVHFPTVQKHTGFETIPHLYWKNDKGVKPANGFQPAFSGHSVSDSCAMKKIDDIESEPFVMPSVQHTVISTTNILVLICTTYLFFPLLLIYYFKYRLP